jgi:hypothetical protein
VRIDRNPEFVHRGQQQVVTQAFAAWRDGTGMIIQGHSSASKEYRDKQQFIDEVPAPLAARFPTFDPFRPITIRSVHADGDTVTVVWDGRGITNDGQPYENSYWIMKMNDGKVIDGTAFFDSISFNELWTRVRRRN